MRAILEIWLDSDFDEGDSWVCTPFNGDKVPSFRLDDDTFQALGQPQYIEVNIQALPRSQNVT